MALAYAGQRRVAILADYRACVEANSANVKATIKIMVYGCNDFDLQASVAAAPRLLAKDNCKIPTSVYASKL
jgi:hypothetical protein